MVVADLPFAWDPNVRLADVAIGYVASAFGEEYEQRALDNQALDVLRAVDEVGEHQRP